MLAWGLWPPPVLHSFASRMTPAIGYRDIREPPVNTESPRPLGDQTMSTATPTRLGEGQRIDQPTFHERYEGMPPGTRAELIEGVVFIPSPVGYEHSDSHIPALVWLEHYARRTSGVQVLDNATVILNRSNEPQPDAMLRIRPEYGGRTKNEGRYLAGAPELVVEVSRSTRYMDLGPKLDAYERAGVLEYIVRASEPDEVIWHILEDGQIVALSPDAEGLLRSRVFPGLWLNTSALLSNDRDAVCETLMCGLNTPEHAAFVARLAVARDHV